jgi:long-chain acyl-CoA synthetase
MVARHSTWLLSLVDRLSELEMRPATGLRLDIGLRWFTYGELRAKAYSIAALLAAQDVGAGERILIWSANSPEWVACLLGILLRGAVAVPLDEGATPDLISRIALETSSRMIFHSADLDPSFLSLTALVLEDVCHLPSANCAEVPVIPVANDHPALIMYTSGTTSSARGVLLTHGNVEAQICRFRRWRLLVRTIPFRMLVIAPLSHVQGLMLGAFIPISLGLSVVFVRSCHPTHLLRTIRDNRITLLSTVPRVLTLLTRALQAHSYGRHRQGTLGSRLSHERRNWMRRHILFTQLNRLVGYRFWVILVGGAALSEDDERFWRQTGRFVIQGYGLTETTALVSFNGPFSNAVGSIGKAHRDIALRVNDDGELLVRGSVVSPAYWEGHSDVPAVKGDYFPTGDLVRQSRGRLYFLGRKKDIIVTAEGFNVVPNEVEGVLNRTSGVLDSVIVPKSAKGCEEVHAVLVLGRDADAAQCVRTANLQLEPHQRIRSWTVWPDSDFPRTPLQKVRREEVRNWAQRLAQAPPVPASRAPITIEAVVQEEDRRKRIELLARYLTESAGAQLQRNRAHLGADLGLSSLDLVELLNEIELSRGVAIAPAHLTSDATVADLYQAALCETGISKSVLPVRQPAWADTLLGTIVRQFGRTVAVRLWTTLCASCSVNRWTAADVRAPLVIAAAPHRHWLDAFLIAAALPEHVARRLLVITNRDFGEFFDRTRMASRRERLIVGLGYYVWLPLTFPFTILPPYGSTRDGLLETLRWLDAGYCPLVFPKGILFGNVSPDRHDPGPIVIARAAGVPVLPIWIKGNEHLGWNPMRRSRAEISIGNPISVKPHADINETRARVQEEWSRLAADGGGR